MVELYMRVIPDEILRIMPSKNVIKQYVSDHYYHLYNRGVNKMRLFTSEQDYGVFLGYLKEYLMPPPDPKTLVQHVTIKELSFQGIPHQNKNYAETIELAAYCLMPNHFHLLIKQKTERGIEDFMRSLLTRYARYFNKTHERVGHVFEGPYKAVMVSGEDYLLHLTRYIHLNPAKYLDDLAEAYSSYADYIGRKNTPWVKREEVVGMLTSNPFPTLKFASYEKFVEEYKDDSGEYVGVLAIDEDEDEKSVDDR